MDSQSAVWVVSYLEASGIPEAACRHAHAEPIHLGVGATISATGFVGGHR